MDLYKNILRPALFKLDAESAHDLTIRALRYPQPWRLVRKRLEVADERLRTNLGGLALANPVGVAPGIDKNAKVASTLQNMGFGYITVGSICALPRVGNPKCRVLRYPEEEALIDCYGLPSDGVDQCVERLKRTRRSTPIVANLDASSIEDYVSMFEKVEPYADAVELTLTCPNNTEEVTNFHALPVFNELMSAISSIRKKPLFVRMLVWETDEEVDNRLSLIESGIQFGVNGFTVPGTWVRHDERLSLGRGHIAGRVAFDTTLQTVRRVSEVVKGRASIKAVGGVSNGRQAYQLLSSGATSVEVLSAFVYQGWGVAKRINEELLAILDTEGITDLAALRT